LSESLEIVHVDFYQDKDGEYKKMTHGVKKVKGEWLHQVCEQQVQDRESLQMISHQAAQVVYTLGS
jgi:cytoplasmic iron level regulating protein YaaA (DUF328/UPF0246 family)